MVDFETNVDTARAQISRLLDGSPIDPEDLRDDAPFVLVPVVLPTRQQVQVLRVVQEALTNVRKHSGATAAVVTVRDDGVQCSVVISDDGHGFDLGSLPPGREGFGLHSMRERMELLGGTLTLDSSPGRGTRVIATVPSPLQFARPTEAARAGQ